MFGVIALLVAGIGVVVFIVGFFKSSDNHGYTMSQRGRLFLTGGLFVVAGVVMLGFASLTSVDEGEVHVPVQFGKALEPLTDKGLQFKSPFAGIVVMPTRTVNVTFEGKGSADESETATNLREINALTAEGAQVGVDMTVLYHVDPTMTALVYAKVGTQWESVLIHTHSRNKARDCLPKYTFEEGRTTRRGEAQLCILDAMQAALGPRGLVIENVLLRDMRASGTLQNAIDEKLEAQSNAQRAEFIQREARVTAETKRIEAEGLANAVIERARGEAAAILEVAKAEAQANHLIAASLTPELLQLRIFEQLNDKTVVITDGALSPLPILPITTE